MKATPNMLSPCCQTVPNVQAMNLSGAPVPKLVPNLCDKAHYILRYHNLKLYLDLGMKLTKIHWTLGFAQNVWLKSSLISIQKKENKHPVTLKKISLMLWTMRYLEKLWKTCKSRWMLIKLVTNQKNLLKRWSHPPFHISSEDPATVNMKKRILFLNRSIYVCLTILDLSEVLMDYFHYNFFVSKSLSWNCCLQTLDSLCYDVKTANLYSDFLQDMDYFYMPEYPREHFLCSAGQNERWDSLKCP